VIPFVAPYFHVNEHHVTKSLRCRFKTMQSLFPTNAWPGVGWWDGMVVTHTVTFRTAGRTAHWSVSCLGKGTQRCEQLVQSPHAAASRLHGRGTREFYWSQVQRPTRYARDSVKRRTIGDFESKKMRNMSAIRKIW